MLLVAGGLKNGLRAMLLPLSMLILLDVHGAAAVRRQRVTPVQKVVELLTKLRVQVQEEGTREAAAYDKFACFCKEQSNDKVYAIKKSDAGIEKLQASIEELGGSISELDLDVTARKADVETEEGEAAKAAEAETERQSAFRAKRANLTDGVDAITQAVAALQASKGAIETALLALPRQTASKLQALGLPVSDLVLLARNTKPGKAMAFEYQSNDVIATLQELLVTFKSELAKCEEEGAAARHDYDMLEGARANKIKSFQKEIDQKEKISAYQSEQKSKQEGLQGEEIKERGEDQAFLDSLTATCEGKATSWDQRSKTRAAELTAMTEAIGILAGVGDLYGANEKLVGLASINRTFSFLQLTVQQRTVIQRVGSFLNREAAVLKSATLASLVTQLGRDDHFVKVRGIIKDLIARLQSEKEAEATQKSFCDTEMSAAVEKRDKQSAAIESHSAEIATRTAEIETLTSEIKALEDEIAKLHKALNDMIELRSIEKASNEKTIADAKDGSAAVKEAIKVLRDFYGEGAALVQGKYTPPDADREGKTVGDLAPETFSGEYDGKIAESKGIFGLLEVISSDFDRTVETTEKTEQEQQAAFEAQKEEMEKEIATREETKDAKSQARETKTSERTGFQDDLKDANVLHADALDQLEKLKASCVEGDETYEERVQRRKQEIEALKQALQILEEWQN